MKEFRLSGMRRSLSAFFLLAVWIIFGALGATSYAADKVIKIGASPDLSGPTAEVGKPFATGFRAHLDYVNKMGGIKGQKIEYLETDGSYSIPKETGAYKRFAMDGVVAFVGYSGGGQMQISQMCTQDKIVSFGASIAEVFADPEKSPYYFIHCASYDQVWRGLIDHEIAKSPGKKPKTAMVYPDNPYGHQNADMIRAHLKKKGLELIDEEIVGFKDIDATTQMLKMKRFTPDAVFCPQVEPSIAVIMRDAKKVGIDTKKTSFYVPLQGMGPVGLKLGGSDVEDLMGGSPFSDWAEKDLPGIKIIREINKEAVLPWYMHGWAAAAVICEGIRMLGDKQVTGENLKAALESIQNFENGKITSPISYSPKNHVGGKGIKIYRASLKDMCFQPITDFIYPE